MMNLSTRQLLDLRPGARLTARLSSGRLVRAVLVQRPNLSPAGKPGVNRVRLVVADIDAAGCDDLSVLARYVFAQHTVAGHNVVEVEA